MRATPKQLTKRALWIALALVLVMVLINLPEPSTVPALRRPPKVRVVPTPSTMPDFSGNVIPAVAGTTTIPIAALEGGTAVISGKVTVGGAPAEGATVRIDRFVGEKSKGVELKTDKDGSYALRNLPGGRYRVRAYRKPDATLTMPQITFLSAGEQRAINISLNRYSSGFVVSPAIAPNPPILGQSANIAVSVMSQGVDDAGVVRSMGQNGVQLRLATDSGRSIVSANPVSTSGRGVAQWTITCNSLSNQGLSVYLPDGTAINLAVASCQMPPETTVPPATTAPTQSAAPGSASTKPKSNNGNGSGKGN